MQFRLLFLSLLLFSCSAKEKDNKTSIRTEIVPEKATLKHQIKNRKEPSFQEAQDALRTLLLNAKPNENLKSSLLQELYLRGLVDQMDNKIKFKLPFDLHGFDCGAPDCYSTDLTFEINATEPIKFPKTIEVKLLEHGCGIDKARVRKGTFKRMERSSKYVNYYSEKIQSNLVILGEKRKLYYFPDTKPNAIKVDLIDKIFDDYNEEDENSIVPYQSTIMTTNEYENFISKE